MENTSKKQTTATQVISPEQLLQHYQGHRKLTRKVIETFPENDFFNHSIGGMRPFSEITKELLAIAVPGLTEIVSGANGDFDENKDYGHTKAQFLEKWDRDTEEINKLWRQIPLERYQEHITLFGQYEGTVQSSILYFIDNEIHHRGQGFVYLRALDIEPPFFYNRD
ncbi:DinB family protein [Allomuricauda sp. F6463D]|uniref:DinB family protein n=1 Tax=Allomuricauda sp. F6463D TaxID=2926409 RepID=UPI001FF67214|nr:DinB family protein [Muricauda sp. F6463D]MCK0159975.1 DinB family protein [Muricauda sp. F6463D]